MELTYFEVVDDYDAVDDLAEVHVAEQIQHSKCDIFEIVEDDEELDTKTGRLLRDCGAADAPALQNTARGFCDQCGACNQLRRCGRCHAALYCSTVCQQAAWKNGHRLVCFAKAAELKASVCDQKIQSSGGAVCGDKIQPIETACARLREEAATWELPHISHLMRYKAVALLHVDRTMPNLLEAHAAGAWTEHHTSGLIDHEDLKLAAHSEGLCTRFRERLFHFALAECLEQASMYAEACGALARAALASHGWVELYHRWTECLTRVGRSSDVQAVHSIAVERGVWQHVMQRPNDLYIPGLRAFPFWNPAEIQEAGKLESAFESILREYRALRDDAQQGLWTPIGDKPLVVKGNWTDFKLIENGKKHQVNCARCPETTRIIQECCPDIATQIRGSVIFSRLEGGTVIKPHCGPTNARIRIHLALEVPEPRPWIRVGNEWRTWEEGKCFVFDDSFEHEVVHKGEAARVVLIADLWHPDLTLEQRWKHLHGRHLRRYNGAAGNGEHVYEPHRVDDIEVRFLENLLRALPEVCETVATMHLDKEGRQTLVVYVECSNPELDPSVVCDCCAARLNAYEVACLVLAVREWPRHADGTINRAKVPPPPQSLLPWD